MEGNTENTGSDALSDRITLKNSVITNCPGQGILDLEFHPSGKNRYLQ